MKKLSIIIFLTLILFLLSSCGDDTTTPPAEDGTSDVTSETSPDTSPQDNNNAKTTVIYHYPATDAYPQGHTATVTLNPVNPLPLLVAEAFDLQCTFGGWQYEDGDGTPLTSADILRDHPGGQVDLYPIYELNLTQSAEVYGRTLDGGTMFTCQFLQQEVATLNSDISYPLTESSFKIQLLNDSSFCQIKTLIIPEGCTIPYIGAYTFQGTSIETVVIEGTVNYINSKATYGSSVTLKGNLPGTDSNNEVFNDVFGDGVFLREEHCRTLEGGATVFLKYPAVLLKQCSGDTLYLTNKFESMLEIAENFWENTVADYVNLYGEEPTHIKKIIVPDYTRIIDDMSLMQSGIELVTDNSHYLSFIRNEQGTLTCLGLAYMYLRNEADGETDAKQDTVTIPSSIGTTQTAVTELDQDFWKNTLKMYHYKCVVNDGRPEEEASLDWIKKIIVPKGITVPDGAFDGFDGEIVYEE